MKAAELKTKTADQLKQQLLDLRKEQFNFRFQKATNQVENTGRIRLVRRDIARIKTVLNEMENGKVQAGKPAGAAKKAAPKAKAKKEIKE